MVTKGRKKNAPRTSLNAASLRARREAAGVTQLELAEGLGVSLQNVKNYEKGLYSAPEAAVDLLAKFEEPAAALARAAKSYKVDIITFSGEIRLPFFRTQEDVAEYAANLVPNPRLASAIASPHPDAVSFLASMHKDRANRMFSRAFDEFSARGVKVLWYYVRDLNPANADERIRLVQADPFLAETENPLFLIGEEGVTLYAEPKRGDGPRNYLVEKLGFCDEELSLMTREQFITEAGQYYQTTRHYRAYAAFDSTGEFA